MIPATVIGIEEKKDKIVICAIDNFKEKLIVSVEVTDAAKCIDKEDSVSWNSDKVFWTPRMRYFHDYPLNRKK